MKYKLLLLILIIYSPFVQSQTGEKLNATVVGNDFTLQGIEVVNLVSKKTASTNDDGKFSIFAKVGDQLMFVSKNYEYKTVTLKEANFLISNLIITLVQKPEELDEVVISTKIKAPFIPNMQALLDTKYADDKYSQKKNPLIIDGTIENGADLMRIGKMILSVFIKERDKTIEVPEIKFKTLVNSNIDPDFFKKTLALKPDEVELFLEFCDADPKSKSVFNNPNPLQIMDFLFAKNNEFKKLPKK